MSSPEGVMTSDNAAGASQGIRAPAGAGPSLRNINDTKGRKPGWEGSNMKTYFPCLSIAVR